MNIKGIEESSDKALRTMQITTVMVVILLTWSAITLSKVGVHLPPWPTPGNLHFSDEALGFAPVKGIPPVAERRRPHLGVGDFGDVLVGAVE